MPHLKICINKSIRPLILFHSSFIHVPDHLLTFTKQSGGKDTTNVQFLYFTGKTSEMFLSVCACACVHITESSLMPALPGDGDM